MVMKLRARRSSHQANLHHCQLKIIAVETMDLIALCTMQITTNAEEATLLVTFVGSSGVSFIDIP